MPSLPLAAAVLVLRHALSQMDRPARESYTMTIVAPDERTAAGVVSIATDLAASLAASLAGVIAQLVAPGLLFVIAGVLRCVYNGALDLAFRDTRPPEENASAHPEGRGISG